MRGLFKSSPLCSHERVECRLTASPPPARTTGKANRSERQGEHEGSKDAACHRDLLSVKGTPHLGG